MASKTGFAVSDSDRRLIRDNAHYIREALFSCITDTQVECSVAFARYLARAGLNAENYWLFLRLVMTNNPWVLDELMHEREPRLLFSTILPTEELVETAFQALFSRHPDEIYPKALEALLGIVENAYFDPDDGYRLRKLSIMDINALGKFLRKDEPQEHPVNRLILEILDKLTGLGEYFQEPDKSVLSKHAFNVRFAYFDRARNMVDAIPHPLLVRFADRSSADPESDYADLITKRRARRRDERGRFIRESQPDAEPTIVAPTAVEPTLAKAPVIERAIVETAAVGPPPVEPQAAPKRKRKKTS
ncbi:MAG TPA: hypothetical protein VMX33_04550 [bacterium]|nr:hypothetical protein [bacterium]